MMAQYIALARKYRPKSFGDVIGHRTITQTLFNAIDLNRIPHAILLTGSHGIGKTTLARIIVKSINCIETTSTTTFNEKERFKECECYQCKSIDEGYNNDVIEIDAATRTGVNDMREIIENSRYKPISAKIKAYIVDEVHMLSISAFNALLKILEEPPLHVMFILATTEVNKIPLTILSRCQRFHLKKIGDNELFELYSRILQNESYQMEEAGLWMVVKAANGSVRDGLSILDQCISLASTERLILHEDIINLLGFKGRKDAIKLYQKVVQGDATSSLQLLQEIYESGIQPQEIMESLLDIVHNATKYLSISNTSQKLEVPEEGLNELVSTIHQYRKTDFVISSWHSITHSFEELKIIPDGMMSLEMLVLKLCHLSKIEDGNRCEGENEQTNHYEKAPEIITKVRNENSDIAKKVDSNKDKDKVAKKSEESTKSDNHIREISDLFDALNSKREVIMLSWLKNDTDIIEFSDQKKFLKVLSRRKMNEKMLQSMVNILSQIMGDQWNMEVSYEDGTARTLHVNPNAPQPQNNHTRETKKLESDDFNNPKNKEDKADKATHLSDHGNELQSDIIRNILKEIPNMQIEKITDKE